MGRSRIYPNPENGTLADLKVASRVGSNETAQRCTAIQLLISGVSWEAVCQALIITERAVRKWVKAFNDKGIDGLVAKKRPGRTSILNGDKANDLAQLIEQPVINDKYYFPVTTIKFPISINIQPINFIKKYLHFHLYYVF